MNNPEQQEPDKEPDKEQPTQQPADADAGSKGPGSPQQPATNVEPAQMARFVTSIKDPARQIGDHVVTALQHADTVAVLTTVVVGPGGEQHIVSAALDPQTAAQVNALLMGAAEQRDEEELCVGFHCLVKPKGQEASQDQ